MVDKIFDYEQDLGIDPNELDEEVLKQPIFYFQYAEELANAQKARDKAKERLDVTRAEIDTDIRTNSDKYDIAKITEAVVTNTILLQDDYQQMIEDLSDKNYEVNILQAAVRAFDHRKKALENLVQLHIASYFAGPKEPRNLPPGKRMADRIQEKASQKQREAINRKKKRK